MAKSIKKAIPKSAAPVSPEKVVDTTKAQVQKKAPSRKPTAKNKVTKLTNMGTGQSFKVTSQGIVANVQPEPNVTVDPASKPIPVVKVAAKKVNITKAKPASEAFKKKMAQAEQELDETLDEIKSKYEKAIEVSDAIVDDNGATGQFGGNTKTDIAINANEGFSGITEIDADSATQGQIVQADNSVTKGDGENIGFGIHEGTKTTSGTGMLNPHFTKEPTIVQPVKEGSTGSIEPQYDSLRLPEPNTIAPPSTTTNPHPRDLTPNDSRDIASIVMGLGKQEDPKPIDMTEGGSVAEMTSAPEPEYFVNQPTNHKTIMQQILQKHDAKGKLLANEQLVFGDARLYTLHLECTLPEPHPVVLWGADIEGCIRPQWVDGNPADFADKKILHFRLTSDGGNRDAQMLEPVVCQVNETKTITLVPRDEPNFPFGNNCHIMDTDKLNGLTIKEIGRIYTYCQPFTTLAVQLVVEA